jgi:hypothetical protein
MRPGLERLVERLAGTGGVAALAANEREPNATVDGRAVDREIAKERVLGFVEAAQLVERASGDEEGLAVVELLVLRRGVDDSASRRRASSSRRIARRGRRFSRWMSARSRRAVTLSAFCAICAFSACTRRACFSHR